MLVVLEHLATLLTVLHIIVAGCKATGKNAGPKVRGYQWWWGNMDDKDALVDMVALPMVYLAMYISGDTTQGAASTVVINKMPGSISRPHTEAACTLDTTSQKTAAIFLKLKASFTVGGTGLAGSAGAAMVETRNRWPTTAENVNVGH